MNYRTSVSYGILSSVLLFSALPVFAKNPEASGKAFTRAADDPALKWAACPDFMPPGCRLAVLQGDPAKHNADVFFRLPGNTTVERHWHTSAERMVLISGELQVDYDRQDPVVMKPGTYAYGPAKLPHTTRCISTEPCVLFIAFEEPVDALPGQPH
jgi:mannose-6-phosphate isomerase-like protein (cupin superfamily)